MSNFFVAMLAGVFIGAVAVEILKRKRPKILEKTGKLAEALVKNESKTPKT